MARLRLKWKWLMGTAENCEWFQIFVKSYKYLPKVTNIYKKQTFPFIFGRTFRSDTYIEPKGTLSHEENYSFQHSYFTLVPFIHGNYNAHNRRNIENNEHMISYTKALPTSLFSKLYPSVSIH